MDDESRALEARVSLLWVWPVALLAVVLFAAILCNNARPIFSVSHYERGDLAANSLQVIRAKHFQPVLGHYCRFGFYHPGPAFFHIFAASEALFYDGLRVVPTPLSAHYLGLYFLSTLFFSATLGVISRWLRGAALIWFLSLALLLAAWHFGAVGAHYNFNPSRPGLFWIWPPCFLLFPFLCFLTAAASLSAGSGRDLPWMTLAACFLVHGHVGMPLFVVPITLLAYGSFLVRRRSARSAKPMWPWQAFPGPHWVAGGMILLFLAPLVIDLIISTPSNLRLIVEHLQTGYGEKKGLLRSLLYFTHFAAYTPYPNSNFIPAFENFDLSGTLQFFRTHWRVYGLWLVVIVTPLVLLTRTRIFFAPRPETGKNNSNAPELRTFLRRMYLILGCAIGLTIVWGCIQEGPMYYYNAFFNFAIYYGLLLIFALAVADSTARKLDRLAASGRGPKKNWSSNVLRAAPILIALVAVASFAQRASQFRSRPQDAAEQQMFATTLERAVKSDSIQPKLLQFEGQAWAETVGVALYLQRAGAEWHVTDYAPSIPLMFGRDRAIAEKETAKRLPNASVWRIVSTASSVEILAKERGWISLPLAKDINLVIKPSARLE